MLDVQVRVWLTHSRMAFPTAAHFLKQKQRGTGPPHVNHVLGACSHLTHFGCVAAWEGCLLVPAACRGGARDAGAPLCHSSHFLHAFTELFMLCSPLCVHRNVATHLRFIAHIWDCRTGLPRRNQQARVSTVHPATWASLPAHLERAVLQCDWPKGSIVDVDNTLRPRD